MGPNQINYLYFGGIFALLVFIVAGSIFTKENLGGSQFFFFLYALGQVVLETTLFIFLGSLIKRYLGKVCFGLFIGVTFFFLVIHAMDFMMDRILDLSVWEALKVFVIEENWDNFLVLLEASGIPIWGWIALFGVVAAIPLLGFALYKASDLIAQRRPLPVRYGYFLQAFVCIPCALAFWDFSASKVIHPDSYTAFIKSLPWKFTFLQPETVVFNMNGSIRKPLSEAEVVSAIESDRTILKKRPNIYLFVIESLRADSITHDIAPHLTAFREKYPQFDMTVSNGNGTHLSWFSIFHSQFPYFWQQAQRRWKSGSPALQLLKKWGYKIHLYTSAQLSYYGMEKLLFGDKLQLLDSKQDFHLAPPARAADMDGAAIAKLNKDLIEKSEYQEGQVFIVFWDGTHFDYSWPKEWAPKFVPFAKEMAYFKAFQSAEAIGQIKNRYHNAVHYMDSLFGSFFADLPNQDESIVIITGDHGEEFFEHGHLFHNSHLTHEQTNVPLYFKWGHGRPHIQRAIVSQMDIFPSLIDYLGGTHPPFLEGNSIFQEAKWPFAVTSRFNAGLTPYEFSIHNGKNKLIAQFSHPNDVFRSRQLHILSLRNYRDQTVYELKNNSGTWIHEEFGPALDRLFGP